MNKYWRLFKNISETVSTAEGLAIDDTLPLSVENKGSPPILHLYTFRPSVIVGKYQDIRSALKIDRCIEKDIDYNRRSTGGGTVIMGPDIMALGLGIPMDYPGLKKGVNGIFISLSHALIEAIETFGVHARFKPKNDLEVMGKKIAGLSAAAETGSSILFHTSLLVDFDIPLMLDIMNTPAIKMHDKGYNCFSQRMTTLKLETGGNMTVQEVIDEVRRSFERNFNITLEEDGPDEWEKNTVQRLIRERYSSNDWIFSHKHPRARMGVGRLKTRAGLLEIYLSLSGATIEDVKITGDFFSTSEDINMLERTLKWTSVREEKIEENLSRVWHDDMIHGLDAPTLARAIIEAKKNQVRV